MLLSLRGRPISFHTGVTGREENMGSWRALTRCFIGTALMVLTTVCLAEAQSTVSEDVNFKRIGLEVVGAIAAVLLLVSLARAIAAGNKTRRDWQEHTSEEQARERDRERQQRERDRQQSERDRHQWDIELENAVALSLKTQEFSDAACEAAALAQLDHLLTVHAQIEMKEAQRQLQSKKREAHYAQLAKYTAANSSLDEAKIIEILRKADEWEYRVLEEAKAIATSVPHYE